MTFQSKLFCDSLKLEHQGFPSFNKIWVLEVVGAAGFGTLMLCE